MGTEEFFLSEEIFKNQKNHLVEDLV